PAPLAGQRVSRDRAAALSGAQSSAGLPLELDCVGATVALDGVTVVSPERFGDRRPDVLAVVPDQEPALPLKAGDQLGGQRVENGRRVGDRGGAPRRRRGEACEEHEAGELKRVT